MSCDIRIYNGMFNLLIKYCLIAFQQKSPFKMIDEAEENVQCVYLMSSETL